VNGLYTAPSTITATQQVTVTATSTANPSIVVSAVVTLVPPATPITVTVSPLAASVNAGESQQYTATVTGTPTTGVTWSLSSPVGTISSAGYYTAPSSVPATQTLTIRATSVADTSKYGTATVTLRTTNVGARTK
jgi:hypothetical protein